MNSGVNSECVENEKDMLFVRRYAKGDEVRINVSFCEVFGAERSIEQWQSKFGVNGEDADIIVAADGEGQILAHCASLRTRVWTLGRVLNYGQSVDVFCLAAARKLEQAIFERCMKSFYESFCTNEGTPLLFGFPGERHLRLGYLKLGYHAGFPVGFYTREAAAKRIWMAKYELRQNFDIQSLDSFWQRCKGRYQSAVVRDGRRLTDRFGLASSKQRTKYGFLAACMKGEVCAWAVYCVDGEKFKIVDVLWDGFDPRAIAELFNGLGRFAFEGGRVVMEMWLNQDILLARTLQESGWKKIDNPERLMVTAVSPGGLVDAGLFLDGFYLTWGDSDLV